MGELCRQVLNDTEPVCQGYLQNNLQSEPAVN